MMNQTISDNIDSFLLNQMQNHQIPGITVGILEEGKISYIRGFGYRNVENFKPMTSNTLVGIGSLSKSFTVLGILKLLSQNKLQLSDPVNKYLDFQLGTGENPIKIHHLLSHSSGVPELDGANYILDRVAESTQKIIPMLTKTEFLNYINKASDEILYKPGTHYYYNNDNFACLGFIIEEIAGMPFVEFITKEIFKPLGLSRTYYTEEQLQQDEKQDCATFYLKSQNDDKLKVKKFPFSPIQYPPGGIISNVHDMMKYFCFLLNKGYIESSEEQLLPENLLDKIFTPIIPMTHSIYKAHYCYGMVKNENLFDDPIWEHGGNIIVSSAYMGLVPEKQTGVFLASNCGHGIPESLGLSILGLILYNNINKAFPFSIHYNFLHKICGQYQSYRGLNTLDISLSHGTLFATLKNDMGSSKFPLILKDSCSLTDKSKSTIFKVGYTLPISNMEMEFILNVQGIHAIYERYVFHKMK
jgi:CubicO group peptidase (beta-lactamase class C family)